MSRIGKWSRWRCRRIWRCCGVWSRCNSATQETRQMERQHMKKLICLLTLVAVVVVVGCGPTKQSGTILPPPPEPPPVPAKQDVSLDPALREEAKNELLSAARDPDP